jgi:hypothetical protein
LIKSRVGVLYASESLVRKDDTEPKCVVSRVSFPDLDLVLGVQQLDQRRQVEPSRPAADDRDAQ